MKSKLKFILPKIAGTVCFVLAFLLILNTLSLVFVPKHSKSDEQTSYITNCYKAAAPHSFDVFFVGNSDVYRAVSPPEIWKSTSLTSCVSGKGCQTPQGAYKILKKMYENQSPSVVVIETDMMFATRSGNSNANGNALKSAVGDVKKIAKQLMKNFDDAAISGISYYFPLLSYHDRWQSLKKTDITNTEASYSTAFNGFISDTNVEGYFGGFDYMHDDGGKDVKLTPKKIKTIDKMVELCESHGSTVIFLEVPSASSWSAGKHDKIQEYADSRNIQFIDLNMDDAVPGFDWTKDSYDGGDHLNTFGAKKVSAVLSEILKSEVKIPDNTTSDSYNEWNSMYNLYLKDMTAKA